MTHPNTATTDTIKSDAEDVAAKARAKADKIVDDATDTAAQHAEEQAENIRQAGAAFEDNPYARQAAEHMSATLTQFADAVRDADLASVQSDVTRFARRNPALFFGGAALLGFVAARAMKASERAEPDYHSSDWDEYPAARSHGHPYRADDEYQWGRV